MVPRFNVQEKKALQIPAENSYVLYTKITGLRERCTEQIDKRAEVLHERLLPTDCMLILPLRSDPETETN